jgi:predicted TIM-barrel fold metal-dependent hydrolase
METTELRIDIHHHMLPDIYLEALKGRGHDISALPEWTPESSLALMDSMGIDKSILSVSSPGTSDPELARALNHYSAGLKAAYPGRFGAFAILPFPDLEASIREVDYALQELDLDGVIFFSNTEGNYLGDPEFDAILNELNRCKATVFVHANDRPGVEAQKGANPFLEYPTDIARAYARLVYSHAFSRFSGIRWIFANAGGVVPFLAERIGKLHYTNGKKLRWGRIIIDLVTGRNSGLDLAKAVYYDTADACSRFNLHALRRLVEPDKILFGSNAPFTPKTTIAKSIEALVAE